MADYFTEAEARDLCDQILARSTADAAAVTVSSGLDGFTRFARNEIATSGEVLRAEARVTSRIGDRSASVRWNDLGSAAIQQAVSRSDELARIAPEDPESLLLLGPQEYVQNEAFFVATEELDAERRADAVLAVTEPAAAADLVAAGFLEWTVGSRAVANTNGLFAYHNSTAASYTTTIRTPDGTGSGWAGTTHNDWMSMVSPADLAAQAIEKTQASQEAEEVAPGRFTVVLEPTAVGNLISLMRTAFDARVADEGRSFFSQPGGGNKAGEVVMDERLTLLSDPADPDLLTCPFASDGWPLSRTVWIEDGVLTNLAYSRYWARQQSRDPVAVGGGMKLTGGDGTTADLIGTVERGILVTRFWYIRPVDQRRLLYTGITRDGTFLIEGGQVTRPVKNLRFNESLMSMLNKVEAIGTAVRIVASEAGGIGDPVVVPPLVVQDFHFTSVSDAV